MLTDYFPRCESAETMQAKLLELLGNLTQEQIDILPIIPRPNKPKGVLTS